MPKVIDFGIAKATAAAVRPGSPPKSAPWSAHWVHVPEQAEPNGLDIDTRSDIYSWASSCTNSSPAAFLPPLATPGGPVRRHAADPPEVEPPKPSAAGRPGDAAGIAAASGRTRKTDGAGPRRAGLDRDEVPGQGPDAAA